MSFTPVVLVVSCDRNLVMSEMQNLKGLDRFRVKNLKAALLHYSLAIKFGHDSTVSNNMLPVYYFNRSCCLLHMGQPATALDDAVAGLALNPGIVLGYMCAVRSCLFLGRPSDAFYFLKKMEEISPQVLPRFEVEKEILERVSNLLEKITKAKSEGDYMKVILLCERCLEYCPKANFLLALKAECLARLNFVKDAKRLANRVLKCDKKNGHAFFVKGLCCFINFDVKGTMHHMEKASSLDSRFNEEIAEVHKWLSVLEYNLCIGKKMLNDGNQQLAIDWFTYLINKELKPLAFSVICYFERAKIYKALNQLYYALDDINYAIHLKGCYNSEFFFLRSEIFEELEQFHNAMMDYTYMLEMEQCLGQKYVIRDLFERANENFHLKLKLDFEKRVFFLNVLGLGPNAEPFEIRKAYKKKVLLHHPDKHPNGNDNDLEFHKETFKLVKAAFEYLRNN